MKTPKYNIFDIVYLPYPYIEVGIIIGVKYLPELEEFEDNPFSYTVRFGEDKNSVKLLLESQLISAKETDFETFYSVEMQSNKFRLQQKERALKEWGLEFFEYDDMPF